MNKTAEFSRLVPLDRIGAAESRHAIEADKGECAALAGRFGLLGLDRLDADFAIRREGEAVLARGIVSADAVQACGATGDPVPAKISEEVELRFLSVSAAPEAEEIELVEAECETLFYEDGRIDLGEAAAETMALALDPFPRSANAEAALREAGVLSEEEAGPFGALKGLRDRLSGNSEG